MGQSFRHNSGITDAKDAEEALKTLLETRGIKETDVDKDKLFADLVKYNPSLFTKDGKVKDNAKWDRLDLPKDLQGQYGVAQPVKSEQEPVQRGYVPIDSSLEGIPDPRARFFKNKGI